jgi:hypothetical protein
MQMRIKYTCATMAFGNLVSLNIYDYETRDIELGVVYIKAY